MISPGGLVATLFKSAAAVAAAVDASFKYVSLLVSGDPSTLSFTKDASTNNAVVIPVGGVRNAAVNPFNGSNYSNVFTTADYFSQASVAVGSSDFTIEGWWYVTAWTLSSLFSQGTADTATGLVVNLQTTGGIQVYSGAAIFVAPAATMPLNRWTHIALVRSGTTFTLFVNGTSVGSGTKTATLSQTPFQINHGYGAVAAATACSISNFRVTLSALYGSAFTPSTAPLAVISGTTLLTCQSSRNMDNSANAYPLTVTGAPKVSPATPFVYTTTSASGYFNGSTDYLTIPDNASLQLGSADFTIEAWINISALPGTYGTLWAKRAASTGFGGAAVIIDSTGAFLMFVANSVSTGWQLSGAATGHTVTLNQWIHVALVRSGSNFTLYKNGVAGTTQTNATAVGDNGALSLMAGSAVGTQTVTGYMSNFRLVKGTAVYTANFTSPVTPLSAVSNTSLLTLQNAGPVNNLGVADSSQNDSVITRVGTPAQGTFSPFSSSGWSGYFNGTSDYVSAAANAALAFGTGDFTVEAWVYFNSTSGAYVPILQGAAMGTGTSDIWFLALTSGALRFMTHSSGSYNASTTWAPSVGQWYHIAVTRTSGATQIYINGTAATMASGASSGSGYNLAQNGLTIGGITTPYYFSGYISNVRVVKGTAVYATTFTPPTAPLTAVSGTALLTLQSNRFVDSSTNALALTSTGTPSIQPSSPFSPSVSYTPAVNGGSVYFNGTADYLTAPASTNYSIGTSNFTIECWVYPSAYGGSVVGGALFHGNGLSQTGYALTLGESQSRCRFISRGTGAWADNVVAAVGPALNAWSHVAVVRNGTALTIYINGVQQGTVTIAAGFTLAGATTVATVGYFSDGTSARYLNGYVSGVRVVSGTAVYTSAFTPPTAPPTAIAGTQVLLNGTNGSMVDSAGKNTLITAGGAPYVQSSVAKYGNAMRFTSFTDWLLLPNNQALAFGTGNFTVECWINEISGTNNGVLTISPATNGFPGSAAGVAIAIIAQKVQVNCAGGSYQSGPTGPTITPNVWHHVAVVRASGVTKLYVNGTLDTSFASNAGQVTDATNYTGTYGVIGAYYTSAYGWNGYIDDVRITKGAARYTANFTPAIAATK